MLRITIEELESKDANKLVFSFLDKLPHIVKLSKEAYTKLDKESVAEYTGFLNMQTEKLFAVANGTGYINISNPTLNSGWTALGGRKEQLKYLNGLAMQAEVLDGTLLNRVLQEREDNEFERKHAKTKKLL